MRNEIERNDGGNNRTAVCRFLFFPSTIDMTRIAISLGVCWCCTRDLGTRLTGIERDQLCFPTFYSYNTVRYTAVTLLTFLPRRWFRLRVKRPHLRVICGRHRNVNKTCCSWRPHQKQHNGMQ